MLYATAAGASASAMPYGIVTPITQGLVLAATLVGRMCDPWERCVRDLESLLGLQDDWDGEGSAAPDPVNVRSAVRLLELARQCGNPLSPPQVVPGGNGEVILAWREGDLYLEAELVTPGKVEWMLAGPGRQTIHRVTELPARPNSLPDSPAEKATKDHAVIAATSSLVPAAKATKDHAMIAAASSLVLAA